MSRPLVHLFVAALVGSLAAVQCSGPRGDGRGMRSGAPERQSTAMAGPPGVPGDVSGGSAGEAPPGGRQVPIQDAFIAVAREVVPAVVSITSERFVTLRDNPHDFFDPFDFFFGPGGGTNRQPRGGTRQYRQSGLGSGVIIGDGGLVLTNNHVVAGARRLDVQLSDERHFDGEVVGRDEPTDLAVLRIRNAPRGLPALRLGDSDRLQIGQWVLAVGAPFGLYETVTGGIISAVGRKNTGISPMGNFLQTDAAINPGNSGGPLVDLHGEVVGINTAIYTESGGYQGVGFATPSSLARKIMDQLVEHGEVVRGWLGVSIQSITPDIAQALGLPDTHGALVADVVPGGPGAAAGIRRGDVIVGVNGQNIADASELMNRVSDIRPGSNADVVVLRGGTRVTLKAKITRRTEEEMASADEGQAGPARRRGTPASVGARLGIEVSPIDSDTRQTYDIPAGFRQGVVIVGIDPAGAAAASDLEEGDLVMEANGTRVDSAVDLRNALARSGPGRNAALLIERGGHTFYTAVRLD